MRLSVALLVLASTAACVPDRPAAHNASIDINAAADAAQQNIDAYGADDPGANRAGASAVTVIPSPSPSPLDPSASGPSAPGAPGGSPDDRTLVAEARYAPDSAQGAANVVQTYYALIGERKYRQAWVLWGNDGAASGMSAAAFAASFARFTDYRADVGAPGDIDAGAGQRYVSVPVQIHGRLKQGAAPFHISGVVTLHRVGDIDGATAAQKSWRIARADVKPAATPAIAPGPRPRPARK